jgi:CubicO group peptidase (beta-lactamase class C family)
MIQIEFKKILAIAVLTLLGYSTTAAQISLSEKQIQLLDSIAIKDVPEKAPGIATAIIQNGKAIYEKVAGYADFADSSLIKRDTRFNIASNGKQFTALAVLTLIDQKKVKRSDDIRKWFPSLYPELKNPITVQSLLNHTSGIRDVYDLYSLQGITWWKQTYENKDVLALLERQTDLNFTPNTKYLYSNSNYILLALLVEKVSKATFKEYTDEIFQQLNMPNTSFESDFTKIRGPIARAYFNFDTWSTYEWIWNVVGDGNLFSTLEDQIQWELLVQGEGKTTFKRKIIVQSQETIEDSNFQNYGYGLELGTYKDLEYHFHEGATGAWKATFIRFPKEAISMITLTNTGKSIPSSQTRQMADVVFNLPSKETFIVTEPPSIGNYVNETEIVGTYLTDNDFAFTFETQEDKIFLKRDGRNDVELKREADNIFHQKYDPAFKQEFTTNSKGEMQVTAYYTNHAPYSLIKVIDLENDFDFKKIDGAYYNSETDTNISIRHLEETNYEISFRSDKTTNGLLVSKNKMLVNSYSLEFHDDALLLNGERIKKVRFNRK